MSMKFITEEPCHVRVSKVLLQLDSADDNRRMDANAAPSQIRKNSAGFN